jgi:hypothetical protein
MPRHSRPLYTVTYSEPQTQMEPVKQKVIVEVKPMTIEKLIAGYTKGEEEELLPGFRYLKKMKKELKKEHIKNIFNKN